MSLKHSVNPILVPYPKQKRVFFDYFKNISFRLINDELFEILMKITISIKISLENVQTAPKCVQNNLKTVVCLMFKIMKIYGNFIWKFMEIYALWKTK